MRLQNNRYIKFILEKFLIFSKFILSKAGYEIKCITGNNNLGLNIFNLFLLFLYCLLSFYNCYQVGVVAINPSYLIFTMNVLALFRFIIGHRIMIKDVVQKYIDNPNTVSAPEYYVRASTVLSLYEGISVGASTIFIVCGRFLNINLFGISALSITSLMSALNVCFIGIEGYMGAIRNMFKADPWVYIRK